MLLKKIVTIFSVAKSYCITIPSVIFHRAKLYKGQKLEILYDDNKDEILLKIKNNNKG